MGKVHTRLDLPHIGVRGDGRPKINPRWLPSVYVCLLVSCPLVSPVLQTRGPREEHTTPTFLRRYILVFETIHHVRKSIMSQRVGKEKK